MVSTSDGKPQTVGVRRRLARAGSSSQFVRRYLYGIFLIVCLVVFSVFVGFGYNAGSLIKDQLHRQAFSLFQEVVVTREWAANHGGVYVRMKPGVEVNPYLSKIPGLKVGITDEQGDRYTLKNPALMTREISEIADRKGIFKFRITSLKPLNPRNAPDGFESAALQRFERGVAEHFEFQERGKETLYRYMAPLVTEKPCLQCHSSQGYREGDIRGGISVAITATDMMQQLRESWLYLLVSAFGIVAIVFAIIRYIAWVFVKDLKVAQQQLVEMATRDPLTGLLNRREALARINDEASRSRRTSRPLSMIIVDIDHFKQVNDAYGHAAGDTALMMVTRRLSETVRKYDILGRYGGEEFLIGTPETSLERAADLADRLRAAVEETVIPSGIGADQFRVTISVGVAELAPDESVERVISRADAALFQAKEAGRNRVATR